MKFYHLVSVMPYFLLGAAAFAGGPIEVKPTAAAKKYCRVVHFPRGWDMLPYPRKDPKLPQGYRPFSYAAGYEFRTVDTGRSRWLVRGYVSTARIRDYTPNLYSLSLDDARVPVRPASEAEWAGATVVLIHPQINDDKIIRATAQNEFLHFAQYQGRRYEKTGAQWAYAHSYGYRLSPDKRFLLLQSWTGKVGTGADENPLWIRGDLFRGKVFFDVYDTNSGAKVVTIEGTYSHYDPGTALGYTFWLTDRYFIVPMGDHRERCLVCDFGKRSPQ